MRELSELRVNALIYKEIEKTENRLKYCIEQISEGRYDNFKDEVIFLRGNLNGLRCSFKIINNL